MQLQERISKLSEHQLRAILIDISLNYEDVVGIAIHRVEQEKCKKGILYR